MKKTTMLVIMDGYGIGKEYEGNAVYLANKPNLDSLMREYPNTLINASGEAVGLPEGQMGNSEVGHMNIGAGRIVYQSLTRINIAIRDGSFFGNEALLHAIDHANKNNTKLHIFGLLSNGGVHSHINHIKALLKLAKEKNVKKVYLHAFLDGRDVAPDCAISFIEEIEETMKELGVGKIATVSGRFYAMDRDHIWERVQKAYDNMTGLATKKFSSASEGVKASYEENVFDEFVVPFLVEEDGIIESNDAVIFANFRPDRAIQIATAFSNPKESGIINKQGVDNIFFVSMMHYAESVKGPIAYALNDLTNTFGDYVSHLGKTQLRIAETQKYAHVTFFFDGGEDKEIPGSTRVLIDSPKIEYFNEMPEMSAYLVLERVLAELDKGYDYVILNFANCDMVGHTGVIPAAIKAVEVVDECVGKIVEKVNGMGGVVVITADHGNSEKLLDENNHPFTAHTTNPVPVIITKKGLKLRSGGNLGDLVPTMFDLGGDVKPKEMTGTSLIVK